jgi:hypothetical protein
MSFAARGAYRELLDMSWGIGPIKDPRKALKLLGGSPALWDEIAPCWTEGPQGWTQERLEVERELANQRTEKASKAGKASARARAKLKVNAGLTLVQRESN